MKNERLSEYAIRKAAQNVGCPWYYQGESDAKNELAPQTPDYGCDRADYDRGYMAGLRAREWPARSVCSVCGTVDGGGCAYC